MREKNEESRRKIDLRLYLESVKSAESEGKTESGVRIKKTRSLKIQLTTKKVTWMFKGRRIRGVENIREKKVAKVSE